MPNFRLFVRLQHIWPRRRRFAARTLIPNAPQSTVFNLKLNPRTAFRRPHDWCHLFYCPAVSRFHHDALSIDQCARASHLFESGDHVRPTLLTASGHRGGFRRTNERELLLLVGPRLTTRVAVVTPTDGRARLNLINSMPRMLPRSELQEDHTQSVFLALVS